MPVTPEELKFSLATISQNVRAIGAALSVAPKDVDVRMATISPMVYSTIHLSLAVVMRLDNPADATVHAFEDLQNALAGVAVGISTNDCEPASIRDTEWATVRDSHNKLLAQFPDIARTGILGDPWPGV